MKTKIELEDVKDFGNAEYFETVDFAKGTLFVGDHSAKDYPQVIWKANGELKTGEKVGIYYRTGPEHKELDTEDINWDRCFWKIELEETSTKYMIRDREAGNVIDEFATEAEAIAELGKYEADDKEEGTYKPNFYEIVECE